MSVLKRSYARVYLWFFPVKRTLEKWHTPAFLEERAEEKTQTQRGEKKREILSSYASPSFSRHSHTRADFESRRERERGERHFFKKRQRRDEFFLFFSLRVITVVASFFVER